MTHSETKKLLVALLKKLIGYESLNNMSVELIVNGAPISHNNIFIAHYEDLLDDIDAYTLYYNNIKNFNLILTDKEDGVFWYKSDISFYTADDDLRVKFTFKSTHLDIISNEKPTTTLERLLDIKRHYKEQNRKVINLICN